MDAELSQNYFDTRAAARFLGLSPRTLEKMRMENSGPRYRKFGSRCVYTINDLREWADNCERPARAASDNGRQS